MAPANDGTRVAGRWNARAVLLLLLSAAAVLLMVLPKMTTSASRHRSLVSFGADFQTTIRSEFKVPKTALSSKLRLVVAVGLEGAGHHYVIGALEQAFKRPVRLNACHMAKNYVVFHALETAPSDYTNAVNQAASDMSALALEEQRAPPFGSIATIQGSARGDRACHDGVGMLSYPNFAGETKVRVVSTAIIEIPPSCVENDNIDYSLQQYS